MTTPDGALYTVWNRVAGLHLTGSWESRKRQVLNIIEEERAALAAGAQATTALPPDALRAALVNLRDTVSQIAGTESRLYHDAISRVQVLDAIDAALALPQPEAPVALDVERLAVALNAAQIQPQEIRLGRDLTPIAERIIASLHRMSR